MNIKTIIVTCGIAACLLAQRASAEEAISYICVEDRSVGWETRDSGETVIGKFKPSETKLIVKWHPHKWVSISSSVRYLVLPKIDVTEAGETYTYESSDCDVLYRVPRFSPNESISKTEESCEALLASMRGGAFGSLNVGYRFSPPISEKPKSMQYGYTQTILFRSNAYVSMGSCSLVE